ncbi:MAG: hypothetical protein R2860_02035 [Desulfobacterales bacterium]
MQLQKGDELPVSAFEPDGIFGECIPV